MNDIITLQAIIVVLGKISVSGKENISRMLGCINTLEDIVKKAQEAQAPQEQEKTE